MIVVVVEAEVVVGNDGTVVVVVAGALCASRTIAFTLTWAGALGVTPEGSNAIVTRRNWVNLIDEGLVVTVGFF